MTNIRSTRLVLGVLTLLLILLAACRQPTAETPTLEPADATPQTAATTSATAPTPGPAADAWAAVQARGRLIVGTSADYPPFAFYTDEFALDGFDVALAQLLGERLGVEVEFSDMAFDGLGGALAVGQIDAAIAAISVTEARRAVVDFSSVYHVSEDAALARTDSAIALRSLADLAPYRVGVQAGSVYETWLQEAGAATGVLSPGNLLAYTETTAAIDDLIAGRVDVIIADRLPLEVVARDDAALAIVGRGLNEQQFAVALPSGSNLTPRINEALAALQVEGTLAELAERYLSLEEAELASLPTPQPEEPARSAAPAAGCLDAMTLVAHLNLDDANMTAPPPISPGAAFQKSWRVQNIGTCAWDSSYQLTPVGGNVPAARMGGRAVPLPGAVAPGQTVDITVDLVAPLTPGVYQGFWSMRAPTGLLFGERIWVGVDVAELPTPTPPPTAIPLPGVTFTVDRDSIRAGECVTFAWDVSGGGQVYFHAEGQPWQLNGVAASDTRVECPNASTTYTLRINQADGTLDLRPIRIDVAALPVPNAPFITFFTVTPSFQIAAGQCIEVRWQVEGDVSNVRVARNDTTLWDGAPLNGTSRDCPPVGEAIYTLDVSGPGGRAAGRQNVTVLPAQATAVPPIGSDQPVVNFFSATPGQIAPGQCVSVAWGVGGNVARVQILRNGVVVLDFALVSGSLNDCLNTPGTYTYRVDAIAPGGGVAFQQASVTVGAPQSTLGGGWRLVNLNGAAIIPGTEITAVFGDGGRLSGSSGCGAYSAAYQLNGSSLAVGSLTGSGQVCDQPAGIMQQEALYQTVLAAASGYTLAGNQLTIRSARGQLTFERNG
jgi:polar amino acid transport system substrate-binding protein